MAARTKRVRGPHAVRGPRSVWDPGFEVFHLKLVTLPNEVHQASINETEDLKLGKKNKHRKPHVHKKRVLRGNNNSSTTSTN